MKIEKLPRQALTFREPLGSIALEENKNKDEVRRFRMVAHSGEIMLGHWFWGNFAIDLEGIQIRRQKKPALREHLSERIVGYTDKITKDGQLIAEGKFSRTTPDGLEVLGLADEGFPWEASIYIPPLKIERVEEGEEVEVNGRKLKGPGTVFRKSRLREVSFCALGADENTKAVALAEGSDLVTLEVEEINACRDGEGTAGEPKMEEGGSMADTITVDKLKEDHPEAANSLLGEGKKEGLKEGAEAERARIAGIREAAFEDMGELTEKFIKDGVSVEDAVRRFNEREKERKADKLVALKDSAPKTTGPGTPEPEEESSNLSVGEKAKQEFAKSAELQEEFGSEATFVAFRKAEAEGRVKILGSKEKK